MYIASMDFNTHNLCIAEGEPLPQKWDNSILRTWLRKKFGDGCIKYVNAKSKKTLNETPIEKTGIDPPHVDSDDIIPLGVFMRKLRKSSKLTLKDASDRSGVSACIISRIENSQQSNISAKNAQKLALLYGVDASEFTARSNKGGENIGSE